MATDDEKNKPPPSGSEEQWTALSGSEASAALKQWAAQAVRVLTIHAPTVAVTTDLLRMEDALMRLEQIAGIRASSSSSLSPASVSPNEWLIIEARRMKAAGEIKPGISQRGFAKTLATAMKIATQNPAVHFHALTVGSIRNRLRGLGIWPIASI
jgi:hypothetical protein